MRTNLTDSSPEGFWARKYYLFLLLAGIEYRKVLALKARLSQKLDSLSGAGPLVMIHQLADPNCVRVLRDEMSCKERHIGRLVGTVRRIAKTHHFPHGK